MAVPYHSFTNGHVSYNPTSPASDLRSSHQLFRPRRVGPGRIRIAAVVNTEFRPDRSSQLRFERSLDRISVKLAVSRENARRFLKSVIPSQNSTESRNNQANGKRRSWSPVKRTQTGEGTGPQPVESTTATAQGDTASNMRAGIRGTISGPLSVHPARPRLLSEPRNPSTQTVQSIPGTNGPSPLSQATPTMDSVVPSFSLDDEKPIASVNGVIMSVRLAEPVLFLQGFENTENSPGNTAMLRGSLHIRVQKSAKIKAVTLKFKGKAITRWPEGIPPRKIEFDETDTIMSHTWPFFNAQFETAEKSTNADHVQLFKGPDGASTTVKRLEPLGASSPNASQVNLHPKDAKKLALSVNQSRSFGKGDTPSGGPGVAAKGYRTFMPGDYIYNFELPLDSRLPETIDVELGSVKYELEATVERSGAFRANLAGTKEVTLIRAPAEGSLEQVEPIAISRNWEDQLHYDIIISGKSFPLGTQVPIAFKLTPLAKVQCHRIKVLVTENIEYFCSNKRVHRMEPTRKVQLFEKRADGPPTSTFAGSTMRVTAGGGIPYDMRARAAAGEEVTPADSTNLLGNLDGDTIGPTEMEFSVQLPSCHAMKERDRSQRLHFDTTYQNIQVHHWIKIVMRLSKPDQSDPTKRRHFEISIDSPFHILSCRATQANISLPAYSSPEGGNDSAKLYDCGCPGAARRRNSPTSFVPTLQSLNTQRLNDADRASTPNVQSPGLARPPTAHIGGPHSMQRPIHLLRAPSFNPPAFEESEPPPPLVTPPPQYDSIASPTSGLADYFARFSDAHDEEDEDELHRSGRVNIPLTPGGRINRSMDIPRDWRSLQAGQ
ncbi:hypothetical protein LTR37_003094 [Vermiconidia calcicola]|uniref:Uncharacterized protein n=1 Tax=Vermiconidia calcicola TaxID=1690605 RepID=A0ACC3NR97_9PEZI|nr:hypothetical protein LTR37_003094 [Vermiconidia calcicola]